MPWYRQVLVGGDSERRVAGDDAVDASDPEHFGDHAVGVAQGQVRRVLSSELHGSDKDADALGVNERQAAHVENHGWRLTRAAKDGFEEAAQLGRGGEIEFAFEADDHAPVEGDVDTQVRHEYPVGTVAVA